MILTRKHTVRALREKHGLSVAELATRAQVSDLSIDQTENGECTRLDVAARIAFALSVNVQDIKWLGSLTMNARPARTSRTITAQR